MYYCGCEGILVGDITRRPNFTECHSDTLEALDQWCVVDTCSVCRKQKWRAVWRNVAQRLGALHKLRLRSACVRKLPFSLSRVECVDLPAVHALTGLQCTGDIDGRLGVIGFAVMRMRVRI